MKIDIVPSLAVLPTLIREVGNSLNVFACSASVDKAGKGRPVTCWPLLFSLFATMLCLVDGLKMGRRAASLTFSLI